MDGTKLSPEKITHMSHVLVQALERMPGLTFTRDANDVRKRLLTVLRDQLVRDLQLENRARRKIQTQRRNIPEGSAEWDILFRKYYEDALAGRGRS